LRIYQTKEEIDEYVSGLISNMAKWGSEDEKAKLQDILHRCRQISAVYLLYISRSPMRAAHSEEEIDLIWNDGREGIVKVFDFEEIRLEVITVEEHAPLHRGISARVAQDVDTSDISARRTRLGKHVAELGAEVRQAKDELEGRLQEEFDHDLGTIHDESVTDVEEQKAKPVPITPEEIAELLRSPNKVGAAIILREIFERPEHRW